MTFTTTPPAAATVVVTRDGHRQVTVTLGDTELIIPAGVAWQEFYGAVAAVMAVMAGRAVFTRPAPPARNPFVGLP